MTGKTKISSKAPNEEAKIEEAYFAQNGVTGAPPCSQAWGWGSQVEHLVAGSSLTGPGRVQPERVMWARPLVGSPTAGGFRRGWCSGIWVAAVGGGPSNQSPDGDSSHGDIECHLAGGERA